VSETLAIVGPVDHKSVYPPVRLKAPDYGTYWILEETGKGYHMRGEKASAKTYIPRSYIAFSAFYHSVYSSTWTGITTDAYESGSEVAHAGARTYCTTTYFYGLRHPTQALVPVV
jgi:hypothetical protein